jgi:hypothetical protein
MCVNDALTKWETENYGRGKKMKTCPKCDRRYVNDELYCNVDGTKLIERVSFPTVIAYLNSDREYMYGLGKSIGLSNTPLEKFTYALYEVKIELFVSPDGTAKITKVDDRLVESEDEKYERDNAPESWQPMDEGDK